MTAPSKGHQELVSYLTLRRVIGALGVLLPVLLVAWVYLTGRTTLEPSISEYYGTEARDLLVGSLFAIGLFLFSYRGHDRRDDRAGDWACVFALGVALFPTTSDVGLVRVLHLVFATALFLVLAYFSLALFTKTDPTMPPTKEKLLRNRLYVTCGVVMLACIAAIVLFYVVLRDSPVAGVKPVFWLESIALWAFGWSWFVKGETLLKDRGTT